MMLEKFNQSMYDHKKAKANQSSDNTLEQSMAQVDMIQILDDVQESFGNPIFLTYDRKLGNIATQCNIASNFPISKFPPPLF